MTVIMRSCDKVISVWKESKRKTHLPDRREIFEVRSKCRRGQRLAVLLRRGTSRRRGKDLAFELQEFWIRLGIIVDGEVLSVFVRIFNVRINRLLEHGKELLDDEVDNVRKASDLRIIGNELNIEPLL